MAETSAQRTGLPLIFDLPVPCPAGELIAQRQGSSGVRCRVERSEILSRTDPLSLVNYCLNQNGYRMCPTWQAEKERIAEGRRAPLVEA